MTGAPGSPPSTDPRQRVSDEHVYHAGAAELRVHDDHPRGFLAHLAHDLGLFPTIDAAQRLQRRARALRGDHGAAILIARGDLELEAEVFSDTRPLTPLVEALKDVAGPGLRFMRDPTRGGVGTVLNELARDSGYGVALWEERLPIRDVVHGACEILGIDPLYVANEGKLLAVVAPEAADGALEALRGVDGGEEAQIIGEVREEPPRMVVMHTQFGGTRMIDMLVGDPLPRIC